MLIIDSEGWKNKIVKQRKINFLSNRKPSKIQKLKLPFQRKFNSGQLGELKQQQSGQFCEDGGSDGWFAKDGAAPPPSFVKSPSNGFLPLG